MKESYEFVVIGSGFGGAITAARLAEAGKSVAILERGKRWDKGEFPRTTGQVARGFWEQGKAYGLVEYRAFKRMDVIQGCGVGGGSLHYFNVHLRPRARIFDSARWPKEFKEPGMLDRYYAKVQEKMESVPLEPPEGRELPERTRVFLDAATKAGFKADLVDIAVYTGPERRNASGVLQDACTYSGNCLLGCNVHAKNTLDITYIAGAERDHGLEVFPLCAATKIEPIDGDKYRVDFDCFDPTDPSAASTPGCVVGERVVVAAGTLGSTELLLRCRDVHKTLPNLSPALGHHFSGNGDFLVPGACDTTALVDPGQGPSITAAAFCETDDNIITIEDLGLPDPFFWFLEGALPPRGSRLWGLAKLAGSYIRQSLGFSSSRRSRVSNEIGNLVAGGRTTHLLPYLGMGTDAANGRLLLRDGKINLDWSHKGSKRMFKEMEAILKKISAATGGRYATSPLWRWPLRKLLTAHPLGGCVVSESIEHGAVDHRGRVWNYPGLYVIDGATIPTALAVNPSLTIGAMAERSASLILREMTQDDLKRP